MLLNIFGQINESVEPNSVGPDQIAPVGAV